MLGGQSALTKHQDRAVLVPIICHNSNREGDNREMLKLVVNKLKLNNKYSDVRFRVASQQSDIPAVITLARAAHEESRFGYIPFSAPKVENITREALKDPRRHAVMLATKGDAPVGFVYCSVGEYHIGAGVLVTSIHNMNVSRDIRASLAGGRVALGLFKGVETWSRARGSQEILFHVTSGVDLARSHKLAKRVGHWLADKRYADGPKAIGCFDTFSDHINSFLFSPASKDMNVVS